MKIYIIIIFVAYSILVDAQFNIKGKIVDKDNFAISNVNIFYKTMQNIGTISDSSGFFSIPFKNDSLIFSHLIYKTKTEKLETKDTSLLFVLEDKIINIKEISILGEKEKLVLQNPWVIDYEITNKNIFIAYVSNAGTVIQIRDFNDEILYQETQKDFGSFQKDCLGNIYLHIAENYYLIDFKSFYYKIINVYTAKEFNDIKYSCDAKIKDFQYYNYFINEKINTIYGYNLSTNENILIRNIVDKSDIQYLNELKREDFRKMKLLDDIYKEMKNVEKDNFQKTKSQNINTNRQLVWKTQILQHEINNDETFRSFVQSKKINSPIYLVNDTVYIIDNVNFILCKYSYNGVLLKESSFNLPSTKIKFIIQDISTEKIYYFFNENNVLKIFEFDIKNLIFNFIKEINNAIEKPIIITDKLFYLEFNDDKKLLKEQWLK